MSEFSLGTAELGTSVDLEGLDKGIADAEEKSRSGFSKIGDILGGALKIGLAGAVVGFAALGGAIASGVGDAREAAGLLAQTNATITSTGGAAERSAEQITDLATALSASAGASLFGDSDVQMAENLLLTFTNIKGAVFDAATAISVDMAQALGGAPKDQAIALGKALNDPIAGVTALTRVGVTFTEEQKEQIRVMQEAGDVAGAQGVILAELNKEFGGSAAAAAAADGGWAQFKDTMGEVFETIGAAVLPILNDLAAWLNSEDVKAGIQAFSDAMVLAFGWLHDNIPPIIELVVAVIDQGVATISGLFQGPMAESLGENAAFFQTTFNQIATIVADVAGIVMAIIGQVSQFITAHGTEIKLVLTATWEVIKAVITGSLAIIQGIVKTTLAVLQGDWAGAWEAIKQMCATVVQSLGSIIKGGLDIIAGFFGTTIDDILSLWAGLGRQAASIGANVVQGIIDGVQGAAGRLMSTLENLASDALQAAKDALGISSPSKEFAAVGEFAVQGIIDGFSGMWPKLINDLNQNADDMIRALKKNVKNGTKEILDELETLVSQVKDIAKDVQGVIADGFGATATIDRQILSNLDKLRDVSAKQLEDTTQALHDAQDAASQFADPKQAADYFKMRSAQIFELAKLQEQLDAAASESEAADVQERMDLIQHAQQAELSAFNAELASGQSAAQSLWDQINELMGSIGGGSGLTDAEIAMQNTLSGLLAQLAPSGSFGGMPIDRGAIEVGGITIYQQPGEDAESLASRVLRLMEDRLAGRM
jgi:phage-related protein